MCFNAILARFVGDHVAPVVRGMFVPALVDPAEAVGLMYARVVIFKSIPQNKI